MTASAKALMQALAVGAAFAQAGHIHAAREEWSGSYRCGARLEGPAGGAGYSAQVMLVLNDGVATITRQSDRVSQALSGKVGADGRVRLEGGGTMRRGKSRWRYSFDGRFEGNKFEARGAALSASGESKIRECTMTLARVSAPMPTAAGDDKRGAPATALAAASERAAVPGEAGMAPESPSTAPGSEMPAVPAAARGRVVAEDKIENRRFSYSREDRILLALFVGIAAAGVGVILYDWRRPTWLTPTNAVTAIVAAGLGTAGLAWYAFSHLNL